MIDKLTLVMAYYNNPTMLALQYKKWAEWSDETKAWVEIVIVDDGSQQPALDVPRPEGLPPLRIYRVLEDRPWHQNGARNLGATVAGTEWLLLTDMDHVVPEETLRALRASAKPKIVYMFARNEAATGEVTLDRHGKPKPHPNTWAMTREMYWKIGGYDERTCGYYGTDSFFREKIRNMTRIQVFSHAVYRYSRDDVADASTTNLKRKEGRPEGWRVRLARKMLNEPNPGTLLFPWRREL